MTSFADKVLSFNNNLKYPGTLPAGISVMNPFIGNPKISLITSQFYKKFYNDNKKRHMILGINPGRFGAGVTGVPFTDTKRLLDKCAIIADGMQTHEPSSVFVYDVIEAYGGVKKFYSEFYISSVCPLGFTFKNERDKEVNYNYYDSKELMKSCRKFIINCIRSQLEFGIESDVCFCMGMGKNFEFLSSLNDEEKFFDEVIPLEHPRFVIQYKLRSKQLYISKYVDKLREKK